MKHLITLNLLFVLPSVLLAADPTPVNIEAVIRTGGKAFLGAPTLTIQKLFDGRGGRDIITTRSGNVLAFHGNQLRESTNGGMIWSSPREIGPDAGGCAAVNKANGDVLLVRGDKGFLWKSGDDGRTWARETIKILPNGFSHGSPDGVPLSVGAFQSGITLQFGKHKGRLLMPGRVFGPKNSNDVEWRPYHYNAAMFSDDGGATWQVSAPFPILIAERQ